MLGDYLLAIHLQLTPEAVAELRELLHLLVLVLPDLQTDTTDSYYLF